MRCSRAPTRRPRHHRPVRVDGGAPGVPPPHHRYRHCGCSAGCGPAAIVVSGAQTRSWPLSCQFAGRTLGMGRLRHPLRTTATCARSSPTSPCAAPSSCSRSWPAGTPPRIWRSWCCAISSASFVVKSHVPLPAQRRCPAGRDRPRIARSRWSCFLVKPETLLRWHRRLVAASRISPRRGAGRPQRDQDLQALIVRLAQEHPRWGYQRIQGELLRLGIQVSATAISTTLRRHRPGSRAASGEHDVAGVPTPPGRGIVA
jgi:hypothetical protein